MDKATAVKLIQKWATSHIKHNCNAVDSQKTSKELGQVVEFIDPENKTQKKAVAAKPED